MKNVARLTGLDAIVNVRWVLKLYYRPGSVNFRQHRLFQGQKRFDGQRRPMGASDLPVVVPGQGDVSILRLQWGRLGARKRALVLHPEVFHQPMIVGHFSQRQIHILLRVLERGSAEHFGW